MGGVEITQVKGEGVITAELVAVGINDCKIHASGKYTDEWLLQASLVWTNCHYVRLQCCI